jgi:hypothetical protein
MKDWTVRWSCRNVGALTAVTILAVGATVAGATQASAGPAAHRSAPVLSRSEDSGGGNLVVVVPPTPDRRHLRELCIKLLSGHYSDKSTKRGDHDKAGTNTVPDLIAATGGTRASATAWCLQYLHPRHGRGPRDHEGGSGS